MSVPTSGPADLVDVPPAVLRVGRAFVDAGARIYLVGGTIRDALLGRPPGPDGDWDLTTDALPEQIVAITAPLAAATWTTGIEFGTVGVQIDGLKLEITTHRADEYDGVSRNPLVRFGDSIVDDLRRRDFTMNAMALALPGREFIDPHGGLADLARGVLRTPAPPEESFGDDPLRMLRAARFVSQLGVALDDDVSAAMASMAGAMARITVERIQAELSKLLLGAHPREGLAVLVETGLAAVVLPELPALAMAADEHGQHKDVYAHTLQVLDQAIGLEKARGFAPDLILRWAALLHDVGKPATRRFEDAGRVTFHHHEVVGARMAKSRLKALKYSNEIIDDVSQLVFLHLRFYGYGRGEWTDSAVRRYVTDAGPLLDRLHVLVRSDTTTRNKRKAATLARTYDELEERIVALRAQEELDSIRPDLDGNEIMQILGIPPGRQIGQAYKHLLALRMENGPMSHEAAVAALHEWAAANIV
ncbi:MAG: cca [Pseudonocardiales bacterium]|nr:cca [Pseudonocardiales bacterium]